MSVIFRRFRRIVAIYCAIAIAITCFCMAPVSVQSAPPVEPYIAHNGEKVSEVTLPESGKLRLMAMTEVTDATAYAWQIRDPQSEEKWINITGANAETLWVTYALVGSMLQSDGTAVLRCALTEAQQTIYTDPVTVTVSFAPQTALPAPQMLQSWAIPKKSAPRASDDDDYKTHFIVINYLFDDNTLAFEPYGATVAHGSDFHDTIVSPTVVGYEPFRRVEGNYIDASKVELNFTNIQSDIIINVVYEPTLVNFSVHHHLQNLYDDDYSISPNFTTTSQEVTGTLVPDGLALSEQALPGFRALAYEKLTVAADGSTVIEIRYDRNYYLIDFDMNGGYGTEPVYTRYGSAVGANDPVRHGYVFTGWELVSYDGRTPTEEEASKYAISASNTITVPDANLRYRARWVAQETTYTMVFWKENADNNEYSYWGYLDDISALSGSIVSAQDWVSRVGNIDDEAYFTINYEKSDKSVLVEGDGSTVVNVYYTRNYYTITFKAPGKCTIPERHTHGDACYDAICDRLEHVHSEQCGRTLLCQVPEHTAHTDACITCGLTAHVHGSADCNCKISQHTHVVTCWGNAVGDRYTLNNGPRNPKNGQVYRSGMRYYIYLLGSWYRYSAYGAASGDIVDPACGETEHTHGTNCNCNLSEHSHTDSCYNDTLHTHTADCYAYSCNQQAHTHENACKRLKCGIPTGHTHSTSCTNSRNTNTVKLVHRKYQQSLADIWPVKDDNNVTYDSGERWSPSNSSYYNAVLVYISEMTPENFTLTLSTANYDTYIMNYYLQTLPGQPYDTTVDGKQYKLSHTINANYNYLTYAEDFFEIVGFDRASSSHKFTNNQIDLAGGGTVNFYYDRGMNPLTFNNNGIILDHKTVSQIQFEAPLKQYYFEPDYPANLEPGAYNFAGWYTSPGCFDGTEVDWDTIRMEDGGLQLYAKWAPITHTVRVFKDATMQEQIGSDQTVAHQSFAHAPEGNVSNGNYVFQGWFYKDIVNGEEIEKAFVFTGIPITKDMDIYAKWSSHISVGYRVEYRLETGEQIADPTVGMAIAGNNKTFAAKAGAELYAGYQEGYYPKVSSHTITMSAEGDHVFTFYYVHVDTMPYKVLYVDAATGDVIDTKVVMDNGLSVVTETFIRIDGKMPDAYQKRLVLVADGTDTDGDGILEENTIVFYYNSDDKHAYYRVVHYIQNIHGDQFREYRSEEAVGNIGQVYDFDALSLAGFSFNGALTKVNGVVQPVNGSKVSATLGGNGLLVELYYQRDTVPYMVRYLDSKTGEEIVSSKVGEGVFGQQAVEYALDLTGLGYELIGEQVRLLNLSADAEYNVLDFTYQERTVSLKYQLVGPAGCGSLSQTSQNVQAISGVASGSVPMAKTGFVFVGWYLDAACTIPVPEDWIEPANQKIVPRKVGEVWQDTTYYAKMIALETDLTIRVHGADARDDQQTFLFRVVGKAGTETAGIDLTVAVTGNDAVTITKLPTGQYTVTELTSWSWRYDSAEASRELTLEYSAAGTTVIYENVRDAGYWLDGNDGQTNIFVNP